MITLDDPDITITKQCQLLGLSRSSYYYEPYCESSWHLEIMRKIDEIFMAHPFYGKRRISAVLKAQGYNVGVDLARTLMKRMGIEAIYPKPNLSKPHPNHRVYPYLLRGVEISYAFTGAMIKYFNRVTFLSYGKRISLEKSLS